MDKAEANGADAAVAASSRAEVRMIVRMTDG